MLLFGISHMGSLVTITTVRLAFFRGEDAVLLIPDYNEPYHQKICSQLQTSKLFDKVIYYDQFIGAEENDTEMLLKTFSTYFKKILTKNEVLVDNITNILTISDLIDPIGMWATVEKIPLTLVEPCVDGFSIFERYNAGKERKMISETYKNLQKELNILCGENGHYKKISYTYDSITKNNYNIMAICKLLTAKEKKLILECYDVDPSTLNDVKTLVILNSPYYVESRVNSLYTEPYINIKKEDYTKVHRIMLWYLRYNETNITIKPHPFGGEYTTPQQFPFSTLLGIYPIELLLLTNTKKIKEAVSFGSTSDQKIWEIVEHYSHYYYMYDYYKIIHELMFAVSIIGDLKLGSSLFVNLLKANLTESLIDTILKRFGYYDIKITENFDAEVFLLSTKHQLPPKYPKKSIIIFLDEYTENINCHSNYKLQLSVVVKNVEEMKTIQLFTPFETNINFETINYQKRLDICDMTITYAGIIRVE